MRQDFVYGQADGYIAYEIGPDKNVLYEVKCPDARDIEQALSCLFMVESFIDGRFVRPDTTIETFERCIEMAEQVYHIKLIPTEANHA